MKEGYKNTELGWIPNEWKIENLDSISSLIDGDRSSNYPSPNEIVDDGIIFLSTSNIKNNKLVYNECKYITQQKFDSLKKGKLKDGDLIITLRGSIGNVAKFNVCEYDTGFINAQMLIIRSEKIDSSFLLWYLTSQKCQSAISTISSGSAQPQLTKKDLSTLKIVVPLLKEQQKIAEILSTVDSQIDDTDKLIERTKELKKGLMQRLLTKGIGHTKFKMTEIGEIPVNWDVKNLLSLSLTKGEYGLGASATEYVLGKPRYLRITDIGEESRLLNNDIRGFEGSEYENFILKEGDIVFARTGNTTGKSYVYNVNDDELVYAGFLIRFRINKELANENYVKYVLQTKKYWDWVKVMSTRSGQPGINSNEYGELKIQLPTLDEQNKIANMLSSLDVQMEEYQNKKMKLEQLKKALMQQLLTGKIRV